MKQNKYEQIKIKTIEPLDNFSHAYLFVINENIDSEKIIYDFIKGILTQNESEEDRKKIISSIDDKTFTEIKEIKADGMWIKKEQMISLKNEFKTKALNSKKRIYIIREADKLNEYSANSILKFLEEPEENIIAILTTNNLGGVLNTIVSRCQVITLPKTNIESMSLEEKLYFLFKNLITKEEYFKNNYGVNFIKNTMNFVLKLEEKKEKMICFSKEYFHNNFKTREEAEVCFQLMILIYKDVFNYNINKTVKNFKDFENDLSKISEKNSKDSLISKIKILLEKKELIKNNISVNLLIDSLIFEFEGVKL